jgi:hypothetical protein
MPALLTLKSYRAKSLTLLSLLLAGCSVIHDQYGETCKTHAYVRTSVEDYISRRFHPRAPARLAIIPFSVPANVAAHSLHQPGLGNELAWSAHGAFLESGKIPIVEVFNRQDWPGKKDEFFTGNFGALALAREAGYDLVFVGYLAGMKRLDTFTVHSKLIEVESGTTLWYGTTDVRSRRKAMNKLEAAVGISNARPDLLHYGPLATEAGRCVVREALKDEWED